MNINESIQTAIVSAWTGDEKIYFLKANESAVYPYGTFDISLNTNRWFYSGYIDFSLYDNSEDSSVIINDFIEKVRNVFDDKRLELDGFEHIGVMVLTDADLFLSDNNNYQALLRYNIVVK